MTMSTTELSVKHTRTTQRHTPQQALQKLSPASQKLRSQKLSPAFQKLSSQKLRPASQKLRQALILGFTALMACTGVAQAAPENNAKVQALNNFVQSQRPAEQTLQERFERFRGNQACGLSCSPANDLANKHAHWQAKGQYSRSAHDEFLLTGLSYYALENNQAYIKQHWDDFSQLNLGQTMGALFGWQGLSLVEFGWEVGDKLKPADILEAEQLLSQGNLKGRKLRALQNVTCKILGGLQFSTAKLEPELVAWATKLNQEGKQLCSFDPNDNYRP